VSKEFEVILGEKNSGHRYSSKVIDRLSIYYGLVLKWNERLHLTTLTAPENFYQRHILESEIASDLIRPGSRKLWDLGTGMGIPGIPISILRPEMEINLVESHRGKAVFLEEAISTLDLRKTRVICARIENLDQLPENSSLTARAIEKMEKLIPEIFRIGSACSQLLIYGSARIKPVLQESSAGVFEVGEHLIPGSEKRFLFDIVPRGTYGGSS
jgi:16S rRNA (guanine(527)-N(7))-methyltransferase RsmG